MGFGDAFAWRSPGRGVPRICPADRLSRTTARAISNLGAFAGSDAGGYDALEPVQWPVAGWRARGARLFADGRFATPDGRARMVAGPPAGAAEACERRLSAGAQHRPRARPVAHHDPHGPAPPTCRAHAEPFVEIHPDDARRSARRRRLTRVRRAGRGGACGARLTDRQRPAGCSCRCTGPTSSPPMRASTLLIPAITDPHSGQPASKHVPVSIERVAAAKYGFAVLRERPSALAAEYWALARSEGGWRIELAFTEDSRDWTAFAASLFAAMSGAETLSYLDKATGQHRFACFDGDRLAGALFLASEPVAVPRGWACEQLYKQHAGQRARMGVIAGRPGFGLVDRGAIVCACFGIGANQIERAMAEGCLSVAAIGRALRAGTNCGSCRGEIGKIINERRLQAAE